MESYPAGSRGKRIYNAGFNRTVNRAGVLGTVEVTATIEAGTLAGNLISCQDVIGKTVYEISNVNTIVVSFSLPDSVPIDNIESIKLDKIDVLTGNATEFEIKPGQNTAIKIYHYNGTTLPTNATIVDDKLQFGRAYAANDNVIESVDSVRLKSITFNGQYSNRITPILSD